MVKTKVATKDSSPLKIVLAKQAEGCAMRKGGDVLSGYLELAESCLVGYDFTVNFEGWCQLSSN